MELWEQKAINKIVIQLKKRFNNLSAMEVTEIALDVITIVQTEKEIHDKEKSK